MYILIPDIIKLGLALLLGGLIGFEREARDKAAGLRTMMLICAGSTLFTMFSIKISGTGDPVRIAANVASGVGFLGAGVIMREGGQVRGLTTASTVWLTAALGIGVGGGELWLATVATGIILFILLFFPSLERWVEGIQEVHTYHISLPLDKLGRYNDFVEMLGKLRLRLRSSGKSRKKEKVVCTLLVAGKRDRHDAFVKYLIEDSDVIEVEN